MTAPAQPSPITLCEQLCRFWQAETDFDGGLLFVESTDDTPGNLYAAPMPERSHRLTPAVSVTTAPATVAASGEAARHLGVSIEARAQTARTALALLNDLVRIIRPSTRPFVLAHVETGGTFDRRGVIGPPPAGTIGASGVDLWRVLQIDVVSSPQVLEGLTGTPGGEASATMTLRCICLPVTMPQPKAAFTIWHATEAGVTEAHVSVDQAGAAITLMRNTTGTDYDLSLYTVTTLISTIDAIGGNGAKWETGEVFGFIGGSRNARALYPVHEAACLTEANKVTVYVWG